MKREVKILLILGAIIGVAVALAVFFYPSGASSPTRGTQGYGVTLREEFVREDSPTLGPKNASVTLVEFLDPECESCRAFFPVVKALLNEYEGRIHFVVRYMPYHSSSLVAIAATEAAGVQGKYWEMQELLFQTADEWGHQPTPRKDLFLKYATTLGLDTAQFARDLEDPRWIQKAQRDQADGELLGVRGTPTFFVNGESVSELSYQSLKKSIETFLVSSPAKVEAQRE